MIDCFYELLHGLDDCIYFARLQSLTVTYSRLEFGAMLYAIYESSANNAIKMR